MIPGLHEKLHKLRLAMGLNTVQFGELVGISASMISRYESGEREPSPQVLVKIATACHVSTDFLLGVTQSTVDAIGIDTAGLTPLQVNAVAHLVSVFHEENREHSQ